MKPNQMQFELAQRHAASQALEGLSDKAKVRHCFQVITGIQDPDAIAALGSLVVLAGNTAIEIDLKEKLDERDRDREEETKGAA